MQESNSVDNYQLMKSFLSQLVGRLDIMGGTTRVALIAYTTVIETGFTLNDHRSIPAVQDVITSLPLYAQGERDASVALRYVRTTLLTSKSGARRDSPNVVVVLMDEESRNITATMVSKHLVNAIA